MSMQQIQQGCAMSVTEEYEHLSMPVKLITFVSMICEHAVCLLSISTSALRNVKSDDGRMKMSAAQIEKHIGALIYGIGCLCSMVGIDMHRAASTYLNERRK